MVGWHVVDDEPLVVTPANWRVNFTDGHVASVRWNCTNAEVLGTLDTNPDVVAAVINTLLRDGATPRSLALRLPVGHLLSAAEVTATRRAIVRFRPAEGSAECEPNAKIALAPGLIERVTGR